MTQHRGQWRSTYFSIIKYLSASYVPGTALNSEDIAVNKTDTPLPQIPCFKKLTFFGSRLVKYMVEKEPGGPVCSFRQGSERRCQWERDRY